MPWLDDLKFDSAGLVPVVAQDFLSGEVLMVAYANREAIRRTIETRSAHYFSRSRSELWRKGETSGNVQEVEEVRVDCDGDSVLYRVRQTGPACHTLERSCFFRSVEDGRLEESGIGGHILHRVEETVRERSELRPEGSYTTYLFSQGIDKILKKIGEEATEVVIAGKNEREADLRSEAADLLFHLIVLFRARGMQLSEIWEEFENRFGKASRIPGNPTVDRSS